MIDNDVIKALDCCSKDGGCLDCPCRCFTRCHELLSQNALDLIKRQQAEIESLRANTPKWISTEDRLPAKSGKYLVWTEIGYADVLNFSTVHQKFNATDHQNKEFVSKYAIEVTHWQAEPEPPEERKE